MSVRNAAMSILDEAWQLAKTRDSSVEAILGVGVPVKRGVWKSKFLIGILLLVPSAGIGVLVGAVIFAGIPARSHRPAPAKVVSKSTASSRRSASGTEASETALQKKNLKLAKGRLGNLQGHGVSRHSTLGVNRRRTSGSPVTLGQVPESIRRSFPDITIAAHVWDQRERDRMIMVNGHVYRHGADIAPGVRLLRITRDGEIVAYRGYRIRLPNR